MRILYYVSIHEHVMQLWQRVHIVNELAGHGIEFEEFDPEHFTSEDHAIAALRSLLRSKRFDLFMTGYGQQHLTPDLFFELRTQGVPSLLFCSDNLLVPFEHLSISTHFDLAWLTSQETEYLFRGRGAKTIFLPYAANPNIYVGASSTIVNRALFIGNPYGSRANIINTLASNEIEVDLYGGGIITSGDLMSVGFLTKNGNQLKSVVNMLRFSVGRKVLLGKLKQKMLGSGGVVDSHYVHRYPGLSFENMYEAYAQYSLSLTSTAARNTGVLQKPVNVINLRSFEVPMSGGVQFCAYSNELADYFEEGREIIFYRSKGEMIEKARYFTSDRAFNDIRDIRRNARERALNDHTWTIRFNKIFTRLGIPHSLAS